MGRDKYRDCFSASRNDWMRTSRQ